jgi:hypothetical protein
VDAALVAGLGGKVFAFDSKLILSQGVLMENHSHWFNMTIHVHKGAFGH